jgi:hypothetical protein
MRCTFLRLAYSLRQTAHTMSVGTTHAHVAGVGGDGGAMQPALLLRGDENALSAPHRSTTSVSALSGGAGVYAWGAHVVPASACRVAAVRAAAAARSRAAVRARSGGGGGGGDGMLVARSGKCATHANWRHDTDEAHAGSSSDGAQVAHGGTRRAPSPCSSQVLFGAAAGAATHSDDAGAPSEAAAAWYDDSGAT